MSNVLNGIIMNYRRGKHTQTTNQMIISIDGIKNKEEAEKLIDKEITWTSPAKKEIKGKIVSAHGRNGAVKAHFYTGMPGQAIGTAVIIK